MTYTAAYYEQIRAGARSSAAAVVPRVFEVVGPRTVVDVGCGEGWWGKAFEDLGCDVVGWDLAADPVIASKPVDLQRRLPRGRFDLALCLEAAEHLDRHRASTFVTDLCMTSSVVLFSAAIPDQGGEGHQNEQWPAYWVDLFAANGFACSAAPRWEFWENDGVESWYRQNLMVAAGQPSRFPQWFDTPLAYPFPVVHPAFMADLMAFIRNMAQLGRIEWR